MDQVRRRGLMRLGWLVLLIGTIANVAEFTLANTVQQGILVPIIALALLDAALIAYVFMHITQLWRPEEQRS